MNSFFGWKGGKMALREVIVECFPLHFEKYIEVFGGAAWVLFHKQQGKYEVYNDQNLNLVTLFRCVRDHPDELKDALHYTLNSREDFNRILSLFRADAEMTDIQRAANYYQLIRHSYAAGCSSFNCQPHDLWRDFPAIDMAHRRLREVITENKDFRALVKHYDEPGSFFYNDPPYFGTEKEYKNVNFSRESHILLRDTLIPIKGKFLLSYNDCEPIRKLYDAPGIYIKEVTRLNNIKQRYDGGSQYPELLIANYDMDERSRILHRQISLFNNLNGGTI